VDRAGELWALFNGALTGLARDGAHYFYSNPLESRGATSDGNGTSARAAR
jgi:DUF1680 family protein